MSTEKGFIMYMHPTCATSYSIIKYLYENNLINKIKIINTSNMFAIPGFKIWSVPWIMRNGRPIATDPVDGRELESLIEGAETTVADPVNAFMNTVLHSVLASSIAVLHSSIKPVVDGDLLNAATRGALNRSELTALINRLNTESENLYREWREKLARALSISFVRDAWWSRGGQLDHDELEAMATPGYIGAWLIAKAGIGRVALPDKPLIYNKEVLDMMSKFIRSSAKGLVRRIEREQRMIINDDEYWSIINKIASII